MNDSLEPAATVRAGPSSPWRRRVQGRRYACDFGRWAGPTFSIWRSKENGAHRPIEQDFEDRVYVAVDIDDDPGRTLVCEAPGHRFFFGVEEVELLKHGESVMNPPRILIAGIGNIFFGDDAFGVEVVASTGGRVAAGGSSRRRFRHPRHRFGLCPADGYGFAILVDAVQRGGAPGTVYLIEPDVDAPDVFPPSMDAHSLDPSRVLGLARSLGGKVARVFLVGCEPASFETEEGSMELSVPVQAAVTEALEIIDSLVAKIRSETFAELEALEAPKKKGSDPVVRNSLRAVPAAGSDPFFPEPLSGGHR